MICSQCRGTKYLHIPEKIRCGMCNGTGEVKSNDVFYKLKTGHISDFLSKKNMTIRELGDALGMNYSNICSSLNGKKTPYGLIRRFDEVFKDE